MVLSPLDLFYQAVRQPPWTPNPGDTMFPQKGNGKLVLRVFLYQLHSECLFCLAVAAGKGIGYVILNHFAPKQDRRYGRSQIQIDGIAHIDLSLLLP